jgi:ATP-binding protein involved in chromosome partitioning
MDKKTVGLSDSFKGSTAPKSFTKSPINGTKFTVAISSAKGGVGKSTFAMNFALALKSIGLKVGILDADIYGPSLPRMMSVNKKPKSEDGKSMTPINQYGVQCMSIGFLVDADTPMIWRGPMVTSAIKTFTQKVLWNDLDFIVVDMPPGTGDTQLTFAQEIKVDGVIIISTPQEIALADVRRGINMFDKLKVPILGLVDNMSFFESGDGKKHNIFGEGGVEKLAINYKKEFLGKIPIDIDLRVAADNGKPLMEENPKHKISKIFIEIATKIKGSFL